MPFWSQEIFRWKLSLLHRLRILFLIPDPSRGSHVSCFPNPHPSSHEFRGAGDLLSRDEIEQARTQLAEWGLDHWMTHRTPTTAVYDCLQQLRAPRRATPRQTHPASSQDLKTQISPYSGFVDTQESRPDTLG